MFLYENNNNTIKQVVHQESSRQLKRRFQLPNPSLVVFKEVNGGLLNVAEGGKARFLESVYMYDVGVTTSSTEDLKHGGCIYNSVRGRSGPTANRVIEVAFLSAG